MKNKKEIIILEEPPMIFTKDADFLERKDFRQGQIILLPEDAVLIKMPIYKAITQLKDEK